MCECEMSPMLPTLYDRVLRMLTNMGIDKLKRWHLHTINTQSPVNAKPTGVIILNGQKSFFDSN